MFWQGVYYGAVFGLLAGVGAWGFLALGGAPLAPTRERAVLTLAACGLFAAAAVCVWVWGARGLEIAGKGLVEAVGYRLEWLLWPFIPDSDRYARAQRVAESARNLARFLLALPAGVPIMVSLAAGGRVREISSGPLAGLALGSLLLWLAVVGQGGKWLLGGAHALAPPQPSMTIPAERARADRAAAEMDSALQMAVAKAKRAKARGENEKAIAMLEQALRDAEADGRSVAHIELHRQLAWLYASSGNIDGAMVMFGTVLGLADPGSATEAEARAAIERLARRSAYSAADAAPRPMIPGEDLGEADVLED